MIQTKIKVLIVEDNKNDAQLIDYHIRKIVKSPEIIHVDKFDALTNALKVDTPDVVISDYKMNGFNGMEVLEYTIGNSTVSDFIFITGTIYDEELAAQTILSGATGYILKKHMNKLHTKLLPYFEKINEKKQRIKLPIGHEEMFNAMNAFIESAKKDNETHIESYTQIKNALEKLKSLNN